MRRRLLRWLARSGLPDPDDARCMLDWDIGRGFSVEPAVYIAGDDRAGLERRLPYCARPTFALDRLKQVDARQAIYRWPKPQSDGSTLLSLSPLERIDHLATLIPPPRLHRYRDHEVLAPSSPLRDAATAHDREAFDAAGCILFALGIAAQGVQEPHRHPKPSRHVLVCRSGRGAVPCSAAPARALRISVLWANSANRLCSIGLHFLSVCGNFTSVLQVCCISASKRRDRYDEKIVDSCVRLGL